MRLLCFNSADDRNGQRRLLHPTVSNSSLNTVNVAFDANYGTYLEFGTNLLWLVANVQFRHLLFGVCLQGTSEHSDESRLQEGLKKQQENAMVNPPLSNRHMSGVCNKLPYLASSILAQHDNDFRIGELTLLHVEPEIA